MPVTLGEFKTRFGKKAIDPTKPKDLYEKRLRDYAAKIKEVLESTTPDAIKAQKLINDAELLAQNGKYAQACDLLFEMNATTVRDEKRRDELVVRLAQATKEGKEQPNSPQDIEQRASDVRSAIDDERYDDADRLIDEIFEANRRAREEHEQAKLEYENRVPAAAKEVQRVFIWTVTRQDLTPQQLRLPGQLNLQARTAAKSAANNKYVVANEGLDRLFKSAEVVKSEPPPEAADKAWLARWAVEQAPLKATVEALASGELPGSVVAPGAILKDKLAEAQEQAEELDFEQALKLLDEANLAFATTQLAAETERNNARRSIDTNAEFFKPGKWPKELPEELEERRATMTELEQQQAEAEKKLDYVGALKHWLQCADDFVALKSAEREKAIEFGLQRDEEAERKRIEREDSYIKLVKEANPQAITELLLDKSADLDLFRKVKGARELLDQMVEDIGPKADTPEKKRLIQAAIRGRFAIPDGITGGEDGKGLSTKALPRIYALLALIPDTHSSDDDEKQRFIQGIDRRKANDTSWYSEKKKNIVLKAGKTGGKNSNFDQTTLHEIGHAVDLKFSFMKKHGAGTEFGGWKEHTLDDVLRVAGEDLSFYKDMGGAPWNIPRALLESYLRACLSGKDPKSLQAQYKAVNGDAPVTPEELTQHPAVQHAVAGQEAAKVDSDLQRDLFFAARKMVKDEEPRKSLVLAVAKEVSDDVKVDVAVKKVLGSLKYDLTLPDAKSWEIMAKHPAVDFANNVFLKPGDSGLWEQGDEGAKRCSVGGRVYQECYKDSWYSYALSARGAKISNYQFRHPMEWFAECYAEFFMEKLSSTHAMFNWLKEQKDGVRT